jgi:2-polyprenyl-3-methyl-5-hydroxy-6-metoxy-1,4-benzoquinol methylase
MEKNQKTTQHVADHNKQVIDEVPGGETTRAAKAPRTKVCTVNASHRLEDKAFEKKGATIYRCGECGCIMADIVFQHEQYEHSNYYTLRRKTVAEIDEEWGFRWRYILSKIMQQGGQRSSLLDIGAGNGYFVALAKREFGLQATGIEISAAETQFAREVVGVELLNDDVARHQENYDVVTCFNVLEHVSDPHGFLANAVARVKPGGLLALTTPNPGCIHARVRGLQRWNMVDPPHHINLFTRKSLDELLRNQGMHPVRYETLSTYINFVRKFDTRGLIFRKIFFYLLRSAGMGADHFILARKQ